MDEDTGTCGICGVDPIEFENINIGLTVINLCNECYEEYVNNYIDLKTNRREE